MKKIIIIILLIPVLVYSQTTLPVKKVTIYKNSTGMVMKQGVVKKSNGKFVITVPKNTLLGTYWISTSKETPIKNVVFKTDTIKVKTQATNTTQIIENNIGKDVTFTVVYNEKSEKVISGKLVSFLPQSNLVKIKQENGKTNIFNVSNIAFMEFVGDNNSLFENDSIVKTAFIDADKTNDSHTFVEYYMQEGFNWIPSYFLRLNNDKDAYLEMKATIENYAENLVDVDCELVVGSPQLYFGKQNDPMNFGWLTINAPKQQAVYRFDNAYSNNQVQTQTTSDGTGFAYEYNANGEIGFETEGEKNNDLYYYQVGKISLPSGTKGFFPIFGANIAYTDKYKAEIPDKVNMANSGYCDNTENIYDVFHSIELKNSTNNPFTTASIMVISEKGQFMAQDLMKYTPIGGTSSIRLSKAIDILLKNTEEEVSRVDNAKRIGRTTYSKAVIKGTVILENLQKKSVVVDVTKSFSGTTTNDGGSTVKKNKRYNTANPFTDLIWNVSLGAGEKKTLTYQYEVYFIGY